jgi:hypothetical protein
VYGSARVVGPGASSRSRREAPLFLRDERGWITGVTVPVAPDTTEPPAAGQGWTLRLDEGWELVPGERAGDWVARSVDEE